MSLINFTSPIEEKLTEALEKSAEYHADGDTPNDAVSKVAAEMNLNPEMTCRVVEMFNVAKTHQFLKTAEDKTASFDIADKAVVLNNVFTNAYHPGEKQATEAPQEVHWMDGGLDRSTKSVVNKTASEDSFRGIPSMESMEFMVHALNANISSFETRASDASVDFVDAQKKGVQSLIKLASYFNSSSCDYSLDDIYIQKLSDAKTAGEKHDVKVIYNLIKGFTKQASETPDDPSPGKYIAFNRNSEPHALFSDVLKFANETNAAEMEKDFNIKQASYAIKAREEIFSILTGKELHTNKIAAENLLGDVSSALTSPVTDISKHVDPYHEGLDSFTKDTTQRSQEEKMRHQYSTDEADNEIDGARRAAILADLMKNDEIIKTQDPKHIQRTYQTVMSISPSVGNMPDVLRAVLRGSSSQQAMDPFTARQMADLENQITTTKKKEEEPSSGGKK